jgi:hypothetical protein
MAYRLSLPLTAFDPILFMGAIVFWWFQEHAMHKHLLHSRFDWYGKRVHEKHHLKPYFHTSLDPAWLMVTWLLTVFVMLKCVLPLRWALTTAIGYAGAGLFYEWSHYIVHTRVRFAKGSYWQRKYASDYLSKHVYVGFPLTTRSLYHPYRHEGSPHTTSFG